MDELGVLELAIAREMSAHVFYAKAAEMTADSDGRTVFNHLARQELGHLKGVRLLREALYEGVSSAGASGDPLDAFLIEVGEVLNEKTSPLVALQIAMDAERASIDLYRRAERETSDSGAREMFGALLSEEQNHLLLLEVELEVLSRTKSFAPPSTLDNFGL